MTASLTPVRRAALVALGDLVIPAADDMPSASAADPAGKYLDRALAAVPRLVPALVRVLDAAQGVAPDAFLAALEAYDPPGFEALTTIVAGAYYANRKVWKRIGYPGQRPAPPAPGEAEHYLRDDLLGPVRARAPLYRATPT